MRKKKTAPKIKKVKNYYLKLYLACFIALLVSFISLNYIFSLNIPCANSDTCLTGLSEKIENNSTGIFQGKNVIPPKIDLAADYSNSTVLGDSVQSVSKHIYVDLSEQKLFAFDGETEFMQTLISTGRWGKTPVGNFNIWAKFRATRMSGGSGRDYYNLPNVPFTMYFYGDFGIHGAYWHNNFGHTMSHGCVNMRIVDAKKLFEWAPGPAGIAKGTAVSICNKFTPPNNCIQENKVK